MRKILLSTVALLMAVSMMAIGNNSGVTKANAIDFDWENGNVHNSSSVLWYRVDLTPLKGAEDPTLALYLTNLEDAAATVQVEATVMGQTEKLNYTIAAKDYKLWSQNAKMLLLVTSELYLTLQSDKQIALSAKVYETEDIVDDACTQAVDFDWNGVVVPAGEKWFRLNLKDVKNSQDKLDFVVTNNGAQAANVAFDLSLDCPASTVMENDWVIAPGAEQRKDFGRVFLDVLDEDYVYLKLTTDQALTLAVEQDQAPIYTGFDCSAAKTLVVGETLNLKAG